MNEKKTIIDLINKIKYVVSEQQLAELAGGATPLTEAEFVDYHRQLDELDLSSGGISGLGGEALAQLRTLLHRVTDLTREIGGKMVPLGRRVIKFVLEMVKRYPRTAKALVIMAALSFLVAHIPLIRLILLPIVQVVGTVVVGLIFLNEYVQGMMAVEVKDL